MFTRRRREAAFYKSRAAAGGRYIIGRRSVAFQCWCVPATAAVTGAVRFWQARYTALRGVLRAAVGRQCAAGILRHGEAGVSAGVRRVILPSMLVDAVLC